MLYYHVPRCSHIKTNGTLCGSPALRQHSLCFFHQKWQNQPPTLDPHQPASSPPSFTMPVLEDADSIQVALMQVLRLILARQLDPKSATLLLHGLRTASLNLRRLQLQPLRPESVTVDLVQTSSRGLRADAWRPQDFLVDPPDFQAKEHPAAATPPDSVAKTS